MLENKEYFDKLILESICDDYQSIWICNAVTREIGVYKVNPSLTIPNISDITGDISQYDVTRNWYIDSFIVEGERDKVKEATIFEKVVNELKYAPSYVVEFTRIIGDKINNNQIYFARLGKDTDIPYFFFGFRDYDIKGKAELDELTGIYNRKSFFWHAENTLSRNPQTRYNLVLSDIVNFKSFNESYGPKAGDELLASAGQYLKTMISDGSVVGRYGGDQFVTLIPEDKYDEFVNNAGNIYLESASSYLKQIEVKYGVCKNISRDKSIISYCDRAHIAVNTIKHTYGQTIAEFNDDIKGIYDRQRIIEGDMQKAIEENQFMVYYQPKHDTKTGKIVGAEALARWIHPTLGFISPGEFIPIFEKNGFIMKLDFYVFQRTCENLKRWSEAGIPLLPISVNASKLTVESQGMVYKVGKVMRENNVTGNLIHIEITESIMTEDADMLIRRLEPLKGRGIQVELDDFGSGYSSINMLSTLPLDVIKLDMSFMRQFGNFKRAKVLEGCVNLAKSLGYKTVSEGVETQEQLESLKTLGVDIIQGFYFSKPLPEEEYEEYLVKHI